MRRQKEEAEQRQGVTREPSKCGDYRSLGWLGHHHSKSERTAGVLGASAKAASLSYHVLARPELPGALRTSWASVSSSVYLLHAMM